VKRFFDGILFSMTFEQKFSAMRKLSNGFNWKRIKIAAGALALCLFASAQVTFPVNGIADPRTGCYAFTHATIVKDGSTTLNNATLVIRDRRITGVGSNASIPKDAGADQLRRQVYLSITDRYFH
jgi:hypothetical protein